MTEIAIVVTNDQRPNNHYQDGDIVAATNDRKTLAAHAATICHHKHTPLNADGLRDTNSLAYVYLENTMSIRWERVNSRQVRRTVIATGDSEIQDMGFDGAVDLYLSRITRPAGFRVFGPRSAAIWYSGAQDYSLAKTTAIWDAIETHTPLLRADHMRWNWTENEKKHFLVLPVIALRDEIVSRVVANEYNTDDRQPGFTSDSEILVARKRRSKVNWRELGLPSATVLDRNVALDVRDSIAPIGTELLAIKPRLSVWSVRDHLAPLNDRNYFV